jgi:serine protease
VVLVDGIEYVPVLDRNGSSLRITLPEVLPYGPLQIAVRVGDRTSPSITLNREAGTVTGKVILPAPPQTLALFSTKTTLRHENTPSTSLIVHHQTSMFTVPAGVPLTGLLERETISELRATRLRFSTVQQAQAAYQQLAGRNSVETLDWDSMVRVSDNFLPLDAGAPTAPGAGQWFLDLEGVPQAWSKTHGDDVVVAVVDTGVKLEHPDLWANLLPGHDFIDDDDSPQDIAGHGTHVAGLVAANGLVTGVAPRAKILPVRVLRDLSGGSAFPVAQGILWAAGLLSGQPNAHPAQVINLSLGSEEYSEVIADAVNKALAHGVIVVAAAGNNGGALSFPAALPGVISVTALAGPNIAYQPGYASRGAGLVVTAYGGDTGQDQDRNGILDGILSTDITSSGYSLRMGTSMACPQVSGLAALAIASGTSSNLVKASISSTATDLGTMGFDARFGHGLMSGRLATPSNPRSYVLAMDTNGKTVGWGLVQTDGLYTINNLPTGKVLEFIASSDQDGDQVLGEAGELISGSLAFELNAGRVLSLADLKLTPSTGVRTLLLNP